MEVAFLTEKLTIILSKTALNDLLIHYKELAVSLDFEISVGHNNEKCKSIIDHSDECIRELKEGEQNLQKLLSR